VHALPTHFTKANLLFGRASIVWLVTWGWEHAGWHGVLLAKLDNSEQFNKRSHKKATRNNRNTARGVPNLLGPSLQVIAKTPCACTQVHTTKQFTIHIMVLSGGWWRRWGNSAWHSRRHTTAVNPRAEMRGREKTARLYDGACQQQSSKSAANSMFY
jgi:hypothetical protein